MTGQVFWFMGLSGSGKSTISTGVIKRVEAEFPDVKWKLLDGDVMRGILGGEIGYSVPERRKSARIMGMLANTLAEENINVIVANISAFEDIRQIMRGYIENYNEIYCKCTIEACIGRDPKGNYKKQFKEGVKDFIGLDIPFEEPQNPDLVIDTEKLNVDEAIQKASEYIEMKQKSIIK